MQPCIVYGIKCIINFVDISSKFHVSRTALVQFIGISALIYN